MNQSSEPALKRYQYSQFDHFRQFRLLQIIATGDLETPWCYDIVTRDLDNNPAYHALSYTWGSPFADNDGADKDWENLPSRLVLKNGTYLTVMQNLYRALSQFAALDISGLFWIDALCINQNDIIERNEQVAIMGDIYAYAGIVVVWLGEEDWNSKVAAIFLEKFLPNLEDLMKREGQDRKFNYSFSDPRLYERIGEDVFSQDIFDGLAIFLERKWFGRAWTFQEIVLAQNVEVYCGPNKIDWVKLEDLLRFLDTSDWDMRLSRFANSSEIQQIPGRAILNTMNHRHRVAQEVLTERRPGKHLESVPSNYNAVDGIMGHLSSLLYSLRLRTASDKRDHLYALYGVLSTLCACHRVRNPLPQPDYQREVAQIFADFCKTILAQSSTLWLLSSVEDRAADDSPYPSWVPDFSKIGNLALPYGAYYYACRRLTPRLRPTTSLSELILDAFFFDEVNAIGESDFELGIGMVPFIKCAQMLLELPVIYHTGQDRAEVLWRTLIADQAREQYPAPASIAGAFYEHMLMHNSMVVLKSETVDHESKLDRLGPLDQLAASSAVAAETIPSLSRILERKDLYANIQAMYDTQDSNNGLSSDQEHDLRQTLQKVLALESKSLPFSRQLGTTFASKRLITTIRGYVGAVPTSAKSGDLVFVLPGAQVPFILSARSDGKHRLVGEAYVHGIMQGEALDSQTLAAREIILV